MKLGSCWSLRGVADRLRLLAAWHLCQLVVGSVRLGVVGISETGLAQQTLDDIHCVGSGAHTSPQSPLSGCRLCTNATHISQSTFAKVAASITGVRAAATLVMLRVLILLCNCAGLLAISQLVVEIARWRVSTTSSTSALDLVKSCVCSSCTEFAAVSSESSDATRLAREEAPALTPEALDPVLAESISWCPSLSAAAASADTFVCKSCTNPIR